MAERNTAESVIDALAPPVRQAPIRNFLGREPRLSSFAVKVSQRGIVTVADFLRAGESSELSSIRTTESNRKRVRKILNSFDARFQPK